MERNHVRARLNMKNRFAAVLLVVIAFLTGFGWIGQAWGQADLARVGILSFSEIIDDSRLKAFMQAFRQTLADLGWVDGKNVTIEYRSAHGDPSRFSEAAEELVGLNVDVILAASAPALRAAYAATRTIPIVAADYTTEPIAEGYVISYARPGGNVTGVFLDAPEFAGKWFELLKAIVPELSRVSVLWDPSPGANHLRAVRSVAESLDIELQVLEVRKPDDIYNAFSALHGQTQALILLPSPLIHGLSVRLASLALGHRLPATSMARDFVSAGGTLAYGPDMPSTWKRCAIFVSKILGGSEPRELPVERPTKINLVVNHKTSTALGITIPQSIRLRADEIIE